MKKRVLSYLIVAILLLTSLPMSFVSVSAETTESLTAGLQKVVLQDLTNYEWYGNVLGSTPLCGENGLGFYNDDVNPRISFLNLQNKDASDAPYIAIKLMKNALPTGSIINDMRVQFVLPNTAGDNNADYVLLADTTLYYDNGAHELQTTTVEETVEGDEFSRVFDLRVGEADSVILYIPTDKLVNGWNAAVVADEVMLSNVVELQLFFTGSDTAGVPHAQAMTIKEIAAYKYPSPADPPAMEEFVLGTEKTVVQDMSAYNLYGNWWNTDVTSPYVDADRGVYFANVEGYHSKADIRFDVLANRDVAGAKYLAVAFGKNGLSVGDVVKIRIEFGSCVLKDNALFYYDNGAAEMQTGYAVQQEHNNDGLDKYTREIALTIGTSDTITLIIPMSSVETNEAMTTLDSIKFNFTDLGNNGRIGLSNVHAVSIKEIAVYKPVDVLTCLGAQTRDPDGAATLALRFVFSIQAIGVGYESADSYNRADLTANSKARINETVRQVVDFGAILSLDDDSELTDSDVNGDTVKKVPAYNLYDVKGNKITYTAKVVDIPNNDSGKNAFIYARPYIAYKVGDQVEYFYGDIISRNVNNVWSSQAQA